MQKRLSLVQRLVLREATLHVPVAAPANPTPRINRAIGLHLVDQRLEASFSVGDGYGGIVNG
jgi:hypothetical protein